MIITSRERDIRKQNITLGEGKKMIRICSVKTHENMMKHIENAIKLGNNVYYSHPEKYKWLIEN